MNNLHITLSEFRNASRIIKETTSIVNKTAINHVFIAAMLSDDLPVQENISDNIEVHRIELKSRKFSKNLFVQLFKYFEFFYRLVKTYKNKEIRVINIHHLAALPIGVYLKYRYSAKLIYDPHELETETSGLSKSKIRKFYAKFIEKLLIRRADLVFCVSDSIATVYKERYNIEKPYVVANAPRYQEIQKSDKFREKFNISNDVKIFLYQGGLERGRRIETLLSVFKELQDLKCCIVFMGRGALQSMIEKYAEECSNIHFHPAVSPQEVLSYTSSADIGFSLVDNSCLNHYYCLPNKFFEYLMAELIVITSNVFELSRIVNQYKLGFVVEDESREAMHRVILDAINMNSNSLMQNIRVFNKNNSWEIQEQQIEDAYSRILK